MLEQMGSVPKVEARYLNSRKQETFCGIGADTKKYLFCKKSQGTD